MAGKPAGLEWREAWGERVKSRRETANASDGPLFVPFCQELVGKRLFRGLVQVRGQGGNTFGDFITVIVIIAFRLLPANGSHQGLGQVPGSRRL